MSNIMTHKRLVSAFIKAGCTVENANRWKGDTNPSQSWVAKNPKNGKCVEWYVQDGFNPVTKTWDKENLITTFVVKRSPDTDAMSDYFCDTFYHTIKASVAAIS